MQWHISNTYSLAAAALSSQTEVQLDSLESLFGKVLTDCGQNIP